MPVRADESDAAMDVERFDGGCSWIAHPKETMQRASHALAVDDGAWLIDPVDTDGLDELLAEYGEVAGVVVCLDRHYRDADALAQRHDVSTWIPDWFDEPDGEFDAPIERFGATLAETGIESHPVVNHRFWREAALYDADREILVVPESLGTSSYFVTGTERLGVHPTMRVTPPRVPLADFVPRVVLVGHGSPVTEKATEALVDALEGSRRRAPRLYASTLGALGSAVVDGARRR
ncbi:hypothetical protein [Halovivax gelatinilyticus]|uniref:hypothetical protein n=1 Tax=Halovivax gelatinilyticus TaxID=2961597 RepID=UPI0020CA5068|nr:hypothetical protein [Halovivax gelatinilyticus]